eukprot:g4462.t1
MRGFAQIVSSSSTQQYRTDLVRPSIGDLHVIYDLVNASSCEVLIRTNGSSINPSDIHPTVATTGGGGSVHILGSDMVGTVVALEDSRMGHTGPTACTGRIKVGDYVWGDIGANTLAKPTNEKTKELGGYAEYALAVESQIAVAPVNAIGWSQAAVLPKVALTSIKALAWYGGAREWRSEKRAPPVVLILGGSGGTGTTGIQLSKIYGAKEIITTTSAANAAYCKSLGATRVIDYHSDDWWNDAVIADGSIDVIYDTVGQAGTGDRAMQKLRAPGGKYVTITGQLASAAKEGTTQAMFINSDSNLNSSMLLDELTGFAEAGKLGMPSVQQSFSLQEIADGFRVSEGGHVVGKLHVATRR